ncbi:MAG: 2Fe-2S iron-sulfur cluster binding domain-containing protein [Clostridiales bacterium]
MSCNIKFITKSKKDKTILEIANKNKVQIKAPCKKGKCGKCIVKVKGSLNPITKEEKKVLSESKIQDGFRLACIAKVLGDVEVELNEQK